MEAIPEDVSHEEMVSAVMSDLIEHKLLSIHGLVVSEDSKDKEMQKATSDIILQDFYVDADGADSEKLKRAMQKEMDNLRELKVFTDVDIKNMNAEEVSRIIDSRWWTHQLMKVMECHECSNFAEAPPDHSIYWLHSTHSNLQKICKTGNFGDRYVCKSPAQCLMHRCCHYHYSLADVDLTSDTVALAVVISDHFIEEQANIARNGSCMSFRIKSLTMKDVHVSGLVTLDGVKMKRAINANAWVTNVTQKYITCK
eukprot:5249960-Amphidinium_carterae.3